jgi:hypothetical protein
MDDKEGRMRRFELGLPPIGNAFLFADAGLTIASNSLAHWMAEKFNRNFDEYDRAGLSLAKYGFFKTFIVHPGSIRRSVKIIRGNYSMEKVYE